MTTDRNSEGAVLTYGLRRRGTEEIIGVIPAKVHAIPVRSGNFQRDYEEVPLYSTPPASIPAAEVQALVERLREQANESDRIAETFDDPERRNWYQGRAEGYEAAADNLAQLIPRNP